jgi:phenylalanyl-tRNA synthetase beta chain
MNVSYAWVRALAPDIEDKPHELADRLAAYGAAVDELVAVGAELDEVLVARVVDARRHPNADRLSLCMVDAGGPAPLQVVCGAPNVTAGAFYPFVPAGGTLPGGAQIRRARIRGEESNGMLCSARELGLGRDDEGILELHGTFQPGDRFLDAVGLRDTRLAVDVTPNRPDLLSHWGIARELSPGGDASLSLPPFPPSNGAARSARAPLFAAGSPEAAAGTIRIRLDDTEGCPRYYGVPVRGVRIGPSPEWLASRLRAIGLRPINNVVDATNFVLHELGQPLHAFDLDRLGTTVVVRRAQPGETLVTLDGESHQLDPEMLVIADSERPVALAGVMGGLDTEVTNETTNILLECALFEPRVNRETRRRAGLSTDASQRFERGVDPDGMERAVRRAVDLIVTVAGGEVAELCPFADAGVAAISPIRLRPARVQQVLGIPFEVSTLAALLEPIGFRTTVTGGEVSVNVPGHRRYDVSREDDLIEEVARRYGYDRFPDSLGPFRPSVVPDDAIAALENRLRERFVALGFFESRSSPFASASAGDLALLLPISSAESHLRRDLAHGLLRRVESNFNRGARGVRLFEIGTVFGAPASDGVPREETHLAAVLTGPRAPSHWSGAPPAFDLWDLRGILEELCDSLSLDIEAGSDITMVDAEVSWRLVASERELGWGGRIRSDAIDAPAWADPIFALELVLTPDMAHVEPVAFRTLAAFPAIERDLALVLPPGVTAAQVEHVARASGGALLEHVSVFDVFADERFGAGNRSVAFRLRFRAQDRTLVDADVDAAILNVLQRLQEEHRVERRS